MDGSINRSSWCRKCCNKNSARWRSENPERSKESVKRAKEAQNKRDPGHRMRSWRWLQYRLTDATFQQLLEAQGGRCAICTEALNPPYVDHDHKTGIVRGLLCFGCNTALGKFYLPSLLNQAIEYLNKTKQNKTEN